MSWPEAFVVVGGAWAFVSLPLGIMFRDYKVQRAILDLKCKRPDIDVSYSQGVIRIEDE